jgi:hypothetical protein
MCFFSSDSSIYFCSKILYDSIGGVMVNRLTSSVVDREFESPVKPMIIQLEFAASPISTLH